MKKREGEKLPLYELTILSVTEYKVNVNASSKKEAVHLFKTTAYTSFPYEEREIATAVQEIQRIP